MPSSWLSSGAGAAQGLEELLTRQRQDEIVRNNMAQHAGTLAETVRSNQANEQFKQQQLAGVQADRGLAQQSLDMQREAQRQKMLSDEQNQERERTIQGERLRPLNTPVEYPKYQQVRSLGVLPMASYKESPGNPLPEGDQGPPLPTINFTGFQPELAAQQNHTDTVTQQGIANTRADQAHADAQANAEATRGATETQRGIQNEIARGNLQDRQQRTADARDKPVKDPTQAQYTVSNYATRLEQAEHSLSKLQSGIAKMNVMSFEFQKRAVPTLQSNDFQSYMQASRNFINAVLRRESGAVISPSEFTEARGQYLPEPGNSPEVLAQKKANRDNVFRSMKAASGAAYQPPIGGDSGGGGQAFTPGSDPSGIR